MGYFSFTKNERRALLVSAWVACCALALLMLFRREPLVLQWVRETPAAAAPYTYKARPKPGSTTPAGAASPAASAPATPAPALDPSPFDPNVADLPLLLANGLPQQVARAILRYREKGGRFQRSEDLRKIYTMTDELYEQVAPWIRIPESRSPGSGRPAVRVDINQDSPDIWQALPGIGPGFAGRICRFRDALGGFSSVAQVGETFGLPDSVFQRIQPLLDMSPLTPGLRVNSLDEEGLRAHPYINRKQAAILVRFRENHGPYKNQEDIRRSRAFTDAELEKLHPYWDYDGY